MADLMMPLIQFSLTTASGSQTPGDCRGRARGRQVRRRMTIIWQYEPDSFPPAASPHTQVTKKSKFLNDDERRSLAVACLWNAKVLLIFGYQCPFRIMREE